jgi:hypothetical protein
MKFYSSKEIDYKRGIKIKESSKVLFYEKKGHRKNDCPKKLNKTSGEKVKKKDL